MLDMKPSDALRPPPRMSQGWPCASSRPPESSGAAFQIGPALLLGVLAESYVGELDAKFNIFDPSIGMSAGLATARLVYRALIGRY